MLWPLQDLKLLLFYLNFEAWYIIDAIKILLEKKYFTNKRPCLLLVKKELSLDNSFKGDFNLNNNLISKDDQNQYIFTGLQIMKNDHLAFFNKNIFSMNEVWTKLINENNLGGLESNQKFYHLNTIEMFEKISSLSSID